MSSGNNTSSDIQLEFARIDDIAVLANFFCGIPTMDDFIHNNGEHGFQSYIDRYPNSETYIANSNGDCISSC